MASKNKKPLTFTPIPLKVFSTRGRDRADHEACKNNNTIMELIAIIGVCLTNQNQMTILDVIQLNA